MVFHDSFFKAVTLELGVVFSTRDRRVTHLDADSNAAEWRT